MEPQRWRWLRQYSSPHLSLHPALSELSRIRVRYKKMVSLVKVITWFPVQFGINKHEEIKTTRLHEPVEQVQFVVFDQFTSAYYTNLQEKSYYYLLIIYIKGYQRRSRQTKFWKHARAIWNLHSCDNFAFVLHVNALVFSQSEARKFFMYIISLFTACTLLFFLTTQITQILCLSTCKFLGGFLWCL